MANRIDSFKGIGFGNWDAEICVVGRCDFSTGLGTMTYAACEMLSRAYPTCILPTEPEHRASGAVFLPNGRRMPVCRDRADMKLFFFCDVIWNGQGDINYLLVPDPEPDDPLRIAWLVFDSDELPQMWVDILNQRFDLLVTTSPHLIEVATRSGVIIPVACLPIALDLAGALARPAPRRAAGRVRFGSVAAFHPRKSIETVTEAFLQAFPDRPDVELVLHSNLVFGDTFDRVKRLVTDAGASNVKLSRKPLPASDKDELIRSFDVLVNCSRGEAYSVGPREALASGCALVLSDVGGHKDLADVPGLFRVPPALSLPARYPEIDGMVFGRQQAVTAPAVAASMRQAEEFARSPAFHDTLRLRREAAAAWSFDRLELAFAALIDEQLVRFRPPQPASPHVIVPPAARAVVLQHLGKRANTLQHPNRIVQVAHDGGFFSIFNAFLSNLVWDQRDGRCHAVLPDWDVERMLAAHGPHPVLSFCYGQPADGNIWCRLFEPVFGFTAEELNDPAVLYHRAVPPRHWWNEWREPHMTYVHAYRLYRSERFQAWRRQYHRVFTRHVQLRPELQAEIDGFSRQHFDGKFVISAHVRHPSHTTEQPGAVIAREDAYFRRIEAELSRRGLAGDAWKIFLATDQDRVVDRFRQVYGDRVAFLTGVRRTRADEDSAFERLSDAERNRDGHQLQHLVALHRANWSLSMAQEVIRDAWLMARSQVVLHVVSNVSTAVAYMNPDADMVFCSPEGAS